MKEDAKQLVVNEGRTKKRKQCVKSLRLTFPAVDVPVNFIIIIVISGLI